MGKVNIVIADQDEWYLKNLADCLMEKTGQFEIYTFSKTESLDRFLSTG